MPLANPRNNLIRISPRRYYTGREAALGWVVVGAVVLTYEVIAPDGQLLSEGIDRALEKHPIATRIGVGLVAMHLLNLIPDRVDPVHRLALLLRITRHPVREAEVIQLRTS